MKIHVLFALFVWQCATVQAQNVDIYTEILPPLQTVDGEKIAGLATARVEHLLQAADLSYGLHIVPWARAYNVVKTTPNTLIYSINRTPEREPYFYWLTTVAEIGNSFIALSTSTLQINGFEDARNHLVGVVREGYSYSLLKEQGFIPDHNMYVVATLEQQLSLLLNGKIDFLFTDIETVRLSLSQQGLDPAMVKVVYAKPEWTRKLYLAANIDTDPHIIQRLQAHLTQP